MYYVLMLQHILGVICELCSSVVTCYMYGVSAVLWSGSMSYLL